jgi:hypothetical protein
MNIAMCQLSTLLSFQNTPKSDITISDEIITHNFQEKIGQVNHISLFFGDYIMLLYTVMYLFMVFLSHMMLSLFPLINLNLIYF